MTLDEIKEALVQMNGSFDLDNEGDQASMVMLSALEVGTKIRPLTKFTGLPQKCVSRFVMRLRSNGIFKGDKIFADWLDPKNGGIAFTTDVLVATGMLKRA